MKLSTILALATFAVATSAHFTLDYPRTRGFDEDLESDSFCGGFHTISTPRSPFYLDGPISIDSHHDSATVNIYLSLSPPTSAQSFLSLPPLRHDISITGQGEFCFHANATGMTGVQDGVNGTIMVEYINNVHGHLYQCADVVFTGDQGVGSNVTCTDSLMAEGGITSQGSIGASATTSATAPSASTPAGSSKANSAKAKGSVSMMGLLVVVGMVAGGLTLV